MFIWRNRRVRRDHQIQSIVSFARPGSTNVDDHRFSWDFCVQRDFKSRGNPPNNVFVQRSGRGGLVQSSAVRWGTNSSLAKLPKLHQARCIRSSALGLEAHGCPITEVDSVTFQCFLDPKLLSRQSERRRRLYEHLVMRDMNSRRGALSCLGAPLNSVAMSRGGGCFRTAKNSAGPIRRMSRGSFLRCTHARATTSNQRHQA